jgi:GT2 family glycosyltransferase
MESKEFPFIYITVLIFNGAEWVVDCLQSLLKNNYPNYRILVIDNASKDDSINIINKFFPQVELIINETNIGFAAGMNLGIDYAVERGADYVFLVNQDTTFDANCLSDLVKVARMDKQFAILVPVQYRYGSDQLHEVFARWLSIQVGVSDLVSLKELLLPFYTVQEVLGAAMLIQLDALEVVGLFDKFYFAFFEETDLCRRMRFHGFQNVFCPRAYFWHDQKTSAKWKEYYMIRSHFIYILKDPFRRSVPRFLSIVYYFFKEFSKRIITKDVHLIKYLFQIAYEMKVNYMQIESRRVQDMTGYKGNLKMPAGLEDF